MLVEMALLQRRVGEFLQRANSRGKKPSQLIALQALYPYVARIRGIDISDTQVKNFNQAARLQGLSEQEMYAIQGDLGPSSTATTSHPELQGKDFYGFHVIVISMGLHHIENPQDLLKNLVERLREGGAIIIIDWVPGIGEPDHEPASGGAQDVTHDQGSHSNQHGHHSASHTVAHVGFSEDQMQKMLKEAGCSEVDYVLHPERSKVPWEIGGEKQLFFARGRK